MITKGDKQEQRAKLATEELSTIGKQKTVVINALQYKRNSSGIGVMIRDLFETFTKLSERRCQIILSGDAPEFSGGSHTEIVRIPAEHRQGLRRVWYQTVQMGRCYGRDSILLVTDSKMPFFLPKSCTAVPLITDLAVYRMPEVYKASRAILWKLQYQYVKRRADFFLAISQFTKDEMVKILGVAPEKIHIVPCACAEGMKRVKGQEKLSAVRNQYALPDPYILFVGNANPRKNLRRLMKAFDLAKEQGMTHQLVIAGEQGWKFDREEELKGLKHPESIRFIGFVPDEDMSALYSAASLFVFPTLYEGFGIPVIEAQACGTPVLTSNCSSLPEVAGEAAVYVDPYDEENMRDGILKALGDQNLRNELIQKGYENAKRFSWQKSAEVLNEIIERNLQV